MKKNQKIWIIALIALVALLAYTGKLNVLMAMINDADFMYTYECLEWGDNGCDRTSAALTSGNIIFAPSIPKFLCDAQFPPTEMVEGITRTPLRSTSNTPASCWQTTVSFGTEKHDFKPGDIWNINEYFNIELVSMSATYDGDELEKMSYTFAFHIDEQNGLSAAYEKNPKFAILNSIRSDKVIVTNKIYPGLMGGLETVTDFESFRNIYQVEDYQAQLNKETTFTVPLNTSMLGYVNLKSRPYIEFNLHKSIDNEYTENTYYVVTEDQVVYGTVDRYEPIKPKTSEKSNGTFIILFFAIILTIIGILYYPKIRGRFK